MQYAEYQRIVRTRFFASTVKKCIYRANVSGWTRRITSVQFADILCVTCCVAGIAGACAKSSRRTAERAERPAIGVCSTGNRGERRWNFVEGGTLHSVLKRLEKVARFQYYCLPLQAENQRSRSYGSITIFINQ